MGSKKDGFGVQSGRGGYHRKSCKTILFESITHYNFNPYVKKSDLQSLCKTVVWNLLLQNAPPLLLPTIEPCPTFGCLLGHGPNGLRVGRQLRILVATPMRILIYGMKSWRPWPPTLAANFTPRNRFWVQAK